MGEAVNVVPSFSMRDHGMYGESVLAPAAALVRPPPGLSDVEAASIWIGWSRFCEKPCSALLSLEPALLDALPFAVFGCAAACAVATISSEVAATAAIARNRPGSVR